MRIRKLKIDDAEDLYRVAKGRKLRRWAINIPKFKTLRDVDEYIKKVNSSKKRIVFGISFKGKVVGCVSLRKINKMNKNAELSYWIGEKYWGRGFATKAVKLALKFAFEKLKLHRIYAVTFEENVASRRVLEKNGFKFEGISREVSFRYGKWRNKLRFGILESEWKHG